ncbi:mitochondrial branched-chain alpha-ketoacid dehydrogenase kinase domain-containing protein [Ditylenchus destructor]|nr:mitochondrial branched-chain alpha-ketoacid dehydrogenase kinase domain-containing protein [Ditylenchus destructor]
MHYSRFRPVSLTMKQYLDFGRNGSATTSYCFLKTELLVRMANIMKEFDLLPEKLLATPSARLVSEWYRQSFEELLYFKNNEPTEENRLKFNNKLRAILQRHSTVVETMAEALMELKETSGIDMASERNIQYFLDRFYLNRISIRMLQSQHLAIFESAKPEKPDQIGYIDPACHVREIVVDAYENARVMCEQYYGDAPSLRLKCVNTKTKSENELENAEGENNEIRVAMVPLHLYYIMFELLKNSMRATIDHRKGQGLPDIDVSVILGQETLSIKVSDQGGGVPQKRMENLFHYLYSTAPQPRRNARETPFAGYGYGLPISRLYARYFLGDLFLFSMEGYGTDACVYFKANPADAAELLPCYGASSRRILSMSPQVPDWCYQVPKSNGNGSNGAPTPDAITGSEAEIVANYTVNTEKPPKIAIA